jgi:ubiquinone/menaquinone biosynthesis C-methylase UbiE
MPDYATIYREYADEYERLVAREDYQLHLPRALNQVRSFDHADIVELGAGTGRVTMIAAAQARSVIACDREPAMLKVAAAKFRAAHYDHVRVALGDNRHLPLADGMADIAISGWSISHAQHWYLDTWPHFVDRVIAEMRRVLRPAGTLIIVETLGTFQTEPHPPHERLAAYYRYLEEQYGFRSMAIRTDYRFETLTEAQSLLGFFFGDEAVGEVERNDWIITPECTGIWWRNR